MPRSTQDELARLRAENRLLQECRLALSEMIRTRPMLGAIPTLPFTSAALRGFVALSAYAEHAKRGPSA